MTFTPAELNTMRNALVDLQANLDELGPCDHPVNVCVCGLRTTLDNLAPLFHRITSGQVGWLPPSEEANLNNAAFRQGTLR